MIQTIKSALGIDPISSLSHESGKIMDVFTSTINKLTKVNNKIFNEIALRDDKIVELENEKEQLYTVSKDNSKVIEKLNKLFD